MTLLWIIFGLDYYFQLNLYQYGNFPRKLDYVYGIFTMHFIHGSIEHLSNNSITLFVLLFLLNKFYKELTFSIILNVILISGIWIWVAARPSFHIGASALIYGISSFIFVSGIIRKHRLLMGISMLIVFLYGSMIWGMFPMVKDNISWEGHLFGALAGLIMAIYYRKRGPQRPQYSWELEEDDEEVEHPESDPPYWMHHTGEENEQIKYSYKENKKKEDNSANSDHQKD